MNKLTVGVMEFTKAEILENIHFHECMLEDCVEFERGWPDFHRQEIAYFKNRLAEYVLQFE